MSFRPDPPCPWQTAGYVLWTVLGIGFILVTLRLCAWADEDMHGIQPEPVAVTQEP